MTDKKQHVEFLQDVQMRMTALQTELSELEVVAKFHSRMAGEYNGHAEPSACVSSTISLDVPPHTMKHIAVVAVLHETKRAMKVGEIVNVLNEVGYGKDKKRRIFFNSIYTALRRKQALFEEVEPTLWGLRVWKNQVDGDGDGNVLEMERPGVGK